MIILVQKCNLPMEATFAVHRNEMMLLPISGMAYRAFILASGVARITLGTAGHTHNYM